MNDRRSVDEQLADTLKATAADFPPGTSPDVITAAQAHAARTFLGGHARKYIQALVDACVARSHPGATPATERSGSRACSRCQMKVKNCRTIVELIEPDRP